MRLAFVGKGGAGKSAIAGTFSRQLAREKVPALGGAALAVALRRRSRNGPSTPTDAQNRQVVSS